jgi:type II secretory ATPase GspE/PulE/Tfp pilus assembly ATPase PilB-like protein
VIRQSKIRSLADIPADLNRCVTAADIRISSEAQQDMILLACPKNQAALIVSETLRDTNVASLRYVREKAAAAGYTVTEYRAEAGLIPLLYRHFATHSQDRAGNVVATAAQQRFDDLIVRAADNKASDIHIVLRESYAEIRFRINGELETITQWTPEQASEMSACAYNVLAGIRDVTWDPSRRQDANIERVIDGRTFRLRYAHAPLYPTGAHIVLRVLAAGQRYQFAESLTQLGYTEAQQLAIENMVAEPSGIVVISGETGSGKSTTIANLMHMIVQDDGLSILTVEDPPEYEVPGVMQSPVIHSADDRVKGLNPYASAIRSAMRRDPDVLMIGEIRDIDTTVLAAQCAQSGHPVLTTVHASRALDIIARLEGMGAALANNSVNRALLCAPRFIAGLIHQVLVPVLCQHCSLPFYQEVEAGRVEQRLGDRVRAAVNPDGVRVRGSGCDHCRGGVTGRTVCAEVITPDAKLRELLLERRDQAAFDYWLTAGGYSIWSHALDKLQAGVVSPRDLEGALGRIRREASDGCH